MLDLPYRSLDHYLDSLPEKTGSYFRRKMRSVKKIRIEYRSSIVGLEARIAELFDNTLKQSKVDYGDFEKLDPDYFPQRRARHGRQGAARCCAGRARSS